MPGRLSAGPTVFAKTVGAGGGGFAAKIGAHVSMRNSDTGGGAFAITVTSGGTRLNNVTGGSGFDSSKTGGATVAVKTLGPGHVTHGAAWTGPGGG